MRQLLRSAMIVWTCAVPSAAPAAINFSVTFNDPNGDLTAASNLI